MARSEAQKRYAQSAKGRAKIIEQKKRYYQRHRELELERHKQYYLSHAQERREYEKERRASIPELGKRSTQRITEWRKTKEGIAARYKEHQKARYGRIVSDEAAEATSLITMIRRELKRAKSK